MNYDHCKISYEFSLDEEKKKEWNNFWSSCHHSYPHQHYLYGEVEKSKKRVPIYILGWIDEKLAFIGLFSIRPHLGMRYSGEAVCLRGPVFDDIDFGKWCLQNIIQYFKELGVGSVRVGPNWSFPEANKVETCLLGLGFSIYETFYKKGRRTTGLIDIELPEDDLLMSFHKSTRYEIRHAERFNVIVRSADDYEEAELFYNHLKKMHRDRGLTCYTKKEFQTMYQAILKDKELGVVLNAYDSDNYLGGILILKGASIVYTAKFVVLNGSTKKLNNLRLAPIVFWRGMLWAKERDCQYLDLEGYSSNTEEAGHVKYIYQYKKGFNPAEIYVLGQYSISCNSLIFWVYKVFSKLKNLLKKPGKLLFKIRVLLINCKIHKKSEQDTNNR